MPGEVLTRAKIHATQKGLSLNRLFIVVLESHNEPRTQEPVAPVPLVGTPSGPGDRRAVAGTT